MTLIAAAIALAFAWPTLFSPPTGQSVRASGRIEGREMTLAAKTIQARVKRLLVDEGDTVAKGQLLAELDATQVEAQVAAAGASVANLDAQVRQAALDVAYTTKNSNATITASDAAVSSAQANLVLARASADTVELKRQQLRALEETRRTASARLDRRKHGRRPSWIVIRRRSSRFATFVAATVV
ncbi:MAG TPA: biotin/lipoyl-binding protein [Vicinamibacterales bacterium]